MIRLTRYQTQRDAIADLEQFNVMYLIKNVTNLRLTYQIEVLARRAQSKGTRLVLRVPADCSFSTPLREFVKNSNRRVEREDY